jgi:Ser/Thr protein kinase RdoA (MazF antagonist)
MGNSDAKDALRHVFVGHLIARGLRVAEVRECVDGQPLRGEDPEDAALAGETLARLHLAAADFVPPGPGADRDPWGVERDLERLRRREQQMQTYLPAPEVTESVRALREALTQAGRELCDADLPMGMIHGDVRPENLLRDAAGEVWVLGFDKCRWAPLLVDVAALAQAFGEPALAAYERQRALTETERRLAPTAARLMAIHSRI